MAWSYASIDGLDIHTLCTTVQSELCRAVNERRECLGLATVDFKYGSGAVEKAYPTAADFDGFPLLDVTGGNDYPISDELQSNLGKLQDQIKGLVNGTYASGVRFATAASGATMYTVATLETAVGLGAFPSTANIQNFRDANVWQRILDALDLLLYPRVRPSADSWAWSQDQGQNSSATRPNADTATYDAFLETAWDAIAAEDSGTTEETAGVYFIYGQNPISGDYVATFNVYEIDVTLDTSIYSGSITKEEVGIDYVSTSNIDTLTVSTSGGGSKAIATGADNSENLSVSSIYTVAADTTISLTWGSLPADHPLLNVAVAPGTGNESPTNESVAVDPVIGGTGAVACQFWLNISGELTDQA